MDDLVVLEWTFSPPDYFEDVIRIERASYTIIISAGKIEARIDPTVYDEEHKTRDLLRDIVNDRFLGVQLLTHKSYELSKSSMYRLHPDGRKSVTVFVDSAVQKMSAGNIDLVVKDKNENIISDSRRDRIEKKWELGELVEKYRQEDKLVESILSFYKTSVHDPSNELIHLYDIWEALKTRFDGQSAVLTALGVSDSDRRALGKLANDEPIRQGRHRGAKISDLRDATEAELDEARKIARIMIEAYLRYLESQNTHRIWPLTKRPRRSRG